MKLIPLSQRSKKGRERNLCAIVDDEDFEELNKYKWQVFKHRNTFYCRRRTAVNGKRISIWMHRLLLSAEYPNVIDHIDRDGLNNQRANLRIATYSQNGANRKSKNKYLGVYFNKNESVYIASVQKNGKIYSKGGFKTESDAALCYNKMAIEHHGEFARLNIIN